LLNNHKGDKISFFEWLVMIGIVGSDGSFADWFVDAEFIASASNSVNTVFNSSLNTWGIAFVEEAEAFYMTSYFDLLSANRIKTFENE
jgi:hypothetical protein